MKDHGSPIIRLIIAGLLVIVVGIVTSIGFHTNLSLASDGSAPETEWDRTFGGPDEDVGFSVQQTSDGGYIIAGSTGSTEPLVADVLLIKTDAEGNKQWDKTFDESTEDYARSVRQTSDGGYIIAGYSIDHPGSSLHVLLIKTDSEGNKQWDRTFGGGGCDAAYAVQQTSDGGYIIAGANSSLGDDCDVWLIKTNSNGDKQWDRTFGGQGEQNDDEATSVDQTSDGGYVITGFTAPRGSGYDDLWLIKTDAGGNRQWDKIFGGTGYYFGTSVQQTADGGYIIAGESLDSSEWGAWLIKTDNSGNKQWDRIFGGTDYYHANSVQQTSDGGYIIAGAKGGYGGYPIISGGDIWLMKTNSAGVKQWEKTFGGSGSETATSAEQTSDGGYIICGITWPQGTRAVDVWLIKVMSEAQLPTGEVWDLPYGIDAYPATFNVWWYPSDDTVVTLADVEDTMPSELLVIWYYGGPGVGWKFFKPGWGADNTLTELVPDNIYFGIVSHATSWDIPQE